ncbi:LysR substrate binding domain protein [compost metagenome]
MGIAFVPESNIRTELKTGALVSLPYGEHLIIKHGIITHKAREPKAASRVFIQQLADYFGYAG